MPIRAADTPTATPTETVPPTATPTPTETLTPSETPTQTPTPTPTDTLTPSATPTVTPTPTPRPCIGDCDGDGVVRVDELLTGVAAALAGDVAACPAFDADGDARIAIDELIAAIGAALNGCPAQAGANFGSVTSSVIVLEDDLAPACRCGSSCGATPTRFEIIFGALLELAPDDRVRHLGGEAGVIDLVHHVEAEDLAAPGHRHPLGVASRGSC